MRQFFFLLMAFASASALTLDEAVALALLNPAKRIDAEAARDAANQRENSAIAVFLPTIGASQTRNDRDIKTQAASETTRYFASLNLFSGFGDFANWSAARNTKEARSHELKAARSDVILAAKSAYFNYFKALDTMKSAEENMRAIKKQSDDAEAFLGQGLIGAFERHQIALEALQSEQTAMKARSDLAVALKSLETTIGAAIAGDLTPPDEAASGDLNASEHNALFDVMLKNRSELKSLAAQIEAQKSQKTRAFAPALPSVDIQIAREKFEYDDGFQGQREQTTTMLTLTWQLPGLIKPYFDREAAFYEQKILESRFADLKKTLALQLTTSLERADLAFRAFVVAEESLKLAEENLRIVQNRFNERIASASDLLDADAALWRAREQRTLYYYDKLLAIAELSRVLEKE
ncbi:MAG: TolC family protein [Helicobacteraceae bacterium]|jgi:outer membrane protein TolC|nr:TolC family protein [Helicobacteraceae bacterium]